ADRRYRTVPCGGGRVWGEGGGRRGGGVGTRSRGELEPPTQPPSPSPADNGETSQYASADTAGLPPHVPDLLTPPMGLHLLCKPSAIMAAPGHFFGSFPLIQEWVSRLGSRFWA